MKIHETAAMCPEGHPALQIVERGILTIEIVCLTCALQGKPSRMNFRELVKRSKTKEAVLR